MLIQDCIWPQRTKWRPAKCLQSDKTHIFHHTYTHTKSGPYLCWYGMSQCALGEGVPLDSDSDSSSVPSDRPCPHRWAQCGAQGTAGAAAQGPGGCAGCCMSPEILPGEKKTSVTRTDWHCYSLGSTRMGYCGLICKENTILCMRRRCEPGSPPLEYIWIWHLF